MAKSKVEKKRPPPDPDPDKNVDNDVEHNESDVSDKNRDDDEKSTEYQMKKDHVVEEEITKLEFTPFEHLMFNVYGKVTRESTIYKALVANGMDTCMHFKYDNEPQYIDNLSFVDQNSIRIQPLNGAIISLIKFYKFIRSLNTRSYRSEESFYSVTFDMWEEHYSQQPPVDVPIVTSHPGFAPQSPPGSPSKSIQFPHGHYSPSKVQLFMKAKRNEAAFMVLKHQNQWLDWYDSTRRHADNQDCSEVLDPDYVPMTEEDEELFKLQKKYMLAVFDTTLKTAKSRQILNAHIEDKDAQAVFREVLTYYTDSTNSSLTAQDLLSKLMRARMLTDGKGMSYEFYLLRYQDELRRYDSLVPMNERLSNAMKNSLTQNLIKGIPCLMNVRSSAGIMKIGTGSDLSFEKYIEALMTAAIEHDDQFRGSSKGGKLNVYSHDIFGDPIKEFGYGELSDDEATYGAYLASGQTGYFPKLTREQWSKLSPEDRTVWDKLSDAGKSIIMHRVNSATKQPPAKRSEKYPGTIRQANMNEASLGDITLSQMLSALAHVRNDSYCDDYNNEETHESKQRWQSEGGYQHQNYAERKIQDVKRICDIVMDRSGAPDDLWFECLSHVADILNHTYNRALKDVPLRVLNGDTPDISPFIRFRFYEKVYYRVDAHSFPSQSREDVGYFVGVSKNVGNAMTFKILTLGTRRIIHRSAVRSADTTMDPNRRVDPLPPPQPIVTIDGEMEPPPSRQLELVSRRELDGEHGSSRADVPIFHPDELIGRTFLYDPENPEGLKHRAKIVGIAGDIAEAVAAFEQNRNRIQYRCSINEGQFEELLTYGEVMDYINRDIANPTVWKFRKIVDHQGPLTVKDKEYAGSPYNVKVAWENGEVTWIPLDQFAKEAPVECAIYAKANDLLHANGWRRFRAMAKKKEKVFERLVKQAKLRSYNTAPRYKYGYEIPRNFLHAILLDERNGNTKWMDATALESDSLHEYSTFRDCGHKDKVRPPEGYKKIRVHFVYDVKHDGRHKARLVADGHLTDIPLDNVYAGVVTIKGVRIVVFVAELNEQELYATDVGNAYLEAKTREKVYIVAGPEFGALKDHILVIVKALYGLRSSNYRWAERLADVLRELGFFPSKSEPDVWMRRCDDLYEYIAVYVDDLLIVSKQPMLIVEALKHTYGFKLKGTGPISFHLGMNFVRDSTNTLSYSPTKYLERMFVNYEQVFGQKPRNYQSPLEPNDHPELDTSEFLDDEKTKTYQSLIGALQWLVTIGRIDIFTAVMSMSSFRSEPRFGHMDRVKRIYGYLYKFRHSAIRVDVSEPDYSTLPTVVHDWDYSVYAGAEEMIPHDVPEPLGKPVLTTTYVDANLYHDMLTGKSVTGILHMINNTPYEWYSKKQATVETATYGSEFSAARTAVEQITDLRLTLRYLGIPVRKTSYLFGDNKSVVDSSVLPGSKLHKRHTMLSYHRVREAIASGIIEFHYIPGELNAADLLSKHWSYAKTWKLILRPLLFLVGGKPIDEEGNDKEEA
ncbi:hypothetical protein FisN_UnNu034 [Fistulifera solaris]|uniref:Reverse transcriptase Ty1/copia-type domain-containing protein n=1 Tax=Fistulifera solaris TaxID=1519565 RepID=A0A1Z5JD30_FISSO|nr:hypothetical protein FisN_UnNu034 [Fistulifera solaris]|eukprot:GAX11913.1 hypothetical protein FisN_UnNu034 [Fistulifera solaris]